MSKFKHLPRKKYFGFTSIDDIICRFPYIETETGRMLLKEVKMSNNSFTEELLQKVCQFKTARSRRKVRKNKQHQIDAIFEELKSTTSDVDKISILLKLKGVGIPTASAILMTINPRKYPIMDTRVWQVLYDAGEVNSKKNGQGFRLNDWVDYLKIITFYAKKHSTTARHIEKVLYSIHTLLFEVDRED